MGAAINKVVKRQNEKLTAQNAAIKELAAKQAQLLTEAIEKLKRHEATKWHRIGKFFKAVK